MGSIETLTIKDTAEVSSSGIEAPNGHFQSAQPEPYSVTGDHIHKKRAIRIICIGAGIAGIAAAYKFQRRLTDATFVIYEKNSDVGGTWFENRYPGCACARL
jgi:NADPH-dependent 2,4-dienoyl-CoA reductase/sulfur reductase-like enzyme